MTAEEMRALLPKTESIEPPDSWFDAMAKCSRQDVRSISVSELCDASDRTDIAGGPYKSWLRWLEEAGYHFVTLDGPLGESTIIEVQW